MAVSLADAVREAELMPVSWAKCLCRLCGEFRLSLPPMKRKRQQIACPRCGKAIWVEESARGGTKRQPRIEPEQNFSHLWQSDGKWQIEVADS